MTSRIVWKIFWVGIVLLIVLIAIALAGFSVPSLPDTIRKASLNIYSMFYWLIPLIMLLFFSPIILDSSSKPDIDILFEPRGDGNLWIVITNRGDVLLALTESSFMQEELELQCPKMGRHGNYGSEKQGKSLTMK